MKVTHSEREKEERLRERDRILARKGNKKLLKEKVARNFYKKRLHKSE